MHNDADRHIERLQVNLAVIHQQIADAAARSGRSATEVTLVGICKYVGVELSRQLCAAGCRQLGENRPQQLCEKAELLSDSDIDWHMVGHLQRNKVRRLLPHIHLLHSVDSLRLLRTLNDESVRIERQLPLLLEVNTSGDPAKHGFSAEEMPAVLDAFSTLPQLKVRGLMTMASLHGGLETARTNFASLRQLRDDLQGQLGDGMQLDELSMGMSGDFEVAVEEGATLVRVGSAIFAGIPPE
jgi:pyridoxal phosphate enzyme (YggS family)